MIRLIPLVALAGLFLGATLAEAGTIRVTTTADQNGEGSKCALREAARAAQDDAAFGGCKAGSGKDTILLERGAVYRLSNPQGSVAIFGDVTVRPAGARGRATIQHAKLDEWAFWAVNSGNRLVRLRIRFGRAGGVLVGGQAGLVVKRSVITRNHTTDNGGGIRNLGTLRLVDSSVTDNLARKGGGIYAFGGSPITVVRSTIADNRATADPTGSGGAISTDGPATIENSTITGNSAHGPGGGIELDGGTTTLRNATVTRNRAGVGDAAGAGGGLHLWGSGASALVVNSILAGNAAPIGRDCFTGPNTAVVLGYTLLGDSSTCSGFFPGPDSIFGKAPKLAPLSKNGGPTKTHALRKKSPARNRGNPAQVNSGPLSCPARDQRGVKRPRGKRCDMGAYER